MRWQGAWSLTLHSKHPNARHGPARLPVGAPNTLVYSVRYTGGPCGNGGKLRHLSLSPGPCESRTPPFLTPLGPAHSPASLALCWAVSNLL